MKTSQGLLQSAYSFNSFGFRPLVRYLRLEHGEVFQKTIEGLSLTADELLVGKRTLNGNEQMQLWGLAVMLRQSDPLIAFRAALLHDIHDSGLVGTLARTCRTIGEVVDIHDRYLHKLDSEGVLSKNDYTDKELSLVFHAFLQAPTLVQEFALAATWIAETQLSSDVQKYIKAMELPGTAEERGLTTEHLRFIEKTYGPILQFGKSRVALTLSKEVLNVTIPTADPGLKLILEKKLRIWIGETLSDDADELKSQVFTAMWELSQNQKPLTLESVAEYMGTQPQKLAYSLRSHDISLQKLKALISKEG